MIAVFVMLQCACTCHVPVCPLFLARAHGPAIQGMQCHMAAHCSVRLLDLCKLRCGLCWICSWHLSSFTQRLPYLAEGVCRSTFDKDCNAGHAADLGTANGHSRSMKRGRSSEHITEHASNGSKRSRLGMPAVSQQHMLTAQNQAELGFQDPQEIALASDSEADTGYTGVLEMVHQVQNDQVSQHACHLKNQLRNLDAAEGIGVMGWLIKGMLTQPADPSAREMIKDWVTDLADFARHSVKLCRT